MKSVAEPRERHYAAIARGLADSLMIYARERRDEDKKNIAILQTELCAFRRAELFDLAASVAPVLLDPDEPSSKQ